MQPPRPTPLPAITAIPAITLDPAEIALTAQIPSFLGCQPTNGTNKETPSGNVGPLIGKRCDKIGGVKAGIDSNMYWRYDGADSAEAGYLTSVANTAANGVPCPGDPPGPRQTSRLHATCVQGKGASILA